MPVTKKENQVRKIYGGNTSVDAGVMPPGYYYVGDLAYVLGGGGAWEEVQDLRIKNTREIAYRCPMLPDGDVPGWTEAYATRVKENVHIEELKQQASVSGKFLLSNGREIVIFDTAYSNGVYTDHQERRYSVKSNPSA